MRSRHDYPPQAAPGSKMPAETPGNAVVRARVRGQQLGPSLGEKVAHVEPPPLPLEGESHVAVSIAGADGSARGGGPEEVVVVAGAPRQEEPLREQPLTRGVRDISRSTARTMVPPVAHDVRCRRE